MTERLTAGEILERCIALGCWEPEDVHPDRCAEVDAELAALYDDRDELAACHEREDELLKVWEDVGDAVAWSYPLGAILDAARARRKEQGHG